jgi:hypothetical protein
MDQKNSIINIQDLGLSVASQHFVDRQPILQIIFTKHPILRKKSIFRNELFYFGEFFIFRKKFRISAGSQYPE